MLLEFRAKNYKSFCDEMVFSMAPAQKQKGLDYSILSMKGGAKTYKGLCSSVVYGPNASGKTNIISAMDTFKQIVLRGHIRNEKVATSLNFAAYALELVPNAFSANPEPLNMSIKFIEDELKIEYSFTADLGEFVNPLGYRRILAESLRVNNEMVFQRKETLRIYRLSSIEEYLNDTLRENFDAAKNLSVGGLIEQELFLMNGFRNLFASKLVRVITAWLKDKFDLVYRADQLELAAEAEDGMRLYTHGPLNDALKEAFNVSNTIGYYDSKDENGTTLISFVADNGQKGIKAEVFESYGTLRFATAVYPLVENALKTGGTLVVDEFDASIHPMVLMNIIKIFHNNEINKNGAQLIFNTHNPIFLNSSLFRRDEIKFVERNEETNCSEVYSLSDFRTSGKYGVRKTDDYMKNYFVNRYGAIKDVDLSEHFLSNMEQDQEEVQ